MYHFISMSWVFHHIQTCFDMYKYIMYFQKTKVQTLNEKVPSSHL